MNPCATPQFSVRVIRPSSPLPSTASRPFGDTAAYFRYLLPSHGYLVPTASTRSCCCLCVLCTHGTRYAHCCQELLVGARGCQRLAVSDQVNSPMFSCILPRQQNLAQRKRQPSFLSCFCGCALLLICLIAWRGEGGMGFFRSLALCCCCSFQISNGQHKFEKQLACLSFATSPRL